MKYAPIIIMVLALTACGAHRKQTEELSQQMEYSVQTLQTYNSDRINALGVRIEKSLPDSQDQKEQLNRIEKLIGSIRGCTGSANKRIKVLLDHFKLKDPLK